MRKILLGVGLVSVLAFGAGLGAIGTLAATDDDAEASAMHHGAVMPMAGAGGMPMGAMAMNGMGAMGTAAMPMGSATMHADVESMDAMHAAMSVQMPAEVRDVCDGAHARMTAALAD